MAAKKNRQKMISAHQKNPNRPSLAKRQASQNAQKTETPTAPQKDLESVIAAASNVNPFLAGAQSRCAQTDMLDIGVYLLSEVSYDSFIFNQSAYDNLLKSIAEDPTTYGIIIDGALTRLDRPEYLNDDLTYWNKSREDALAETEQVHNNQQYQRMMDKQFEILETRLCEIRQRVPHAQKVVLSVDSDDLGFTASAILNEKLIRRQGEVRQRIQDLKNEKRRAKAGHTALAQKFESVKGHTGGKREIKHLQKEIQECTEKISSIDEQLTDAYQEQKLYREKKVRPMHQQVTREFIEELYTKYQEICDKNGVTLVKNRGILEFDGLRIDYAHTRTATWMPLKSRDSGMVNATHGKLRDLVEREGVHAVIESGHSGSGFKQLQKLYDHPSETNFQNQSSYDPQSAGSTVTLVLAMPFEDQRKITEILDGKHPFRFSASKPMGSRKHHIIDRAKNDSVSGVTVLRRTKEGILGTEWIGYELFVNGKALNQPEEYSIIAATSDEHIGSPEEDPMVRDGLISYYDKLLEGKKQFRGRKAIPRGFISGGDTAEANSRKWNDRYAARRSPQEVLLENIRLIGEASRQGKTGSTSPEDLVKIILKTTNDSMQGSVESMRVNLDRAADYYDEFLRRNLTNSRLKYVHVSVPGNHADNVLRDIGIRESDFFVKRHEDIVYEVGVPHYHLSDPEKDARAFIGGYSVARVAQIPQYGIGVDGSTVFGPISLYVQHDPKGSGSSGLVGAARSSDADVALAGHTHENYVKIFKRGDNKIGVAYRMATLQGVTPTEKMYAFSVPRTQAAHLLIMPQSGHFYEEAIPAQFLREKGREDLSEKVKIVLAK
jgi:hypothetical protein